MEFVVPVHKIVLPPPLKIGKSGALELTLSSESGNYSGDVLGS